MKKRLKPSLAKLLSGAFLTKISLILIKKGLEWEFTPDECKVPPDIIPAMRTGRSENLREEFVQKYADEKTGMLKLPLTATYTVLSAVGDELGKRFDESQETAQKFLHIRNNSILAHGIKPVKKEHYEKY